jgi:MFS family permease
MDEKHNLLLKSGDQDQSRWWDTRIKISIFALLYGCANQIRSTTETQFVYAYLKNNTDNNNNTYLNSSLNKTTKEDQNCIVNSTGGTDDYIQGLASDWTWYIELITYGFALLVLIVLGPLSDQIGRKPVLVYNLLFTAISFGARAYVIYADLGLNRYLSLSAIEGMAGGHYMFNLACCAVLSNCTKADGERPFMLAIYDAMLGIGMSCSQIAAGYLINLFGFTYPYLISTGLICIICLLLLWTLQETKKEKQDIKTSSFATGIFTFCTQSSAINKDKRKYLFIYFIIFALHLFPIAANSAIKILFTLGSPFCWSSVHIGWYSAGASFGELVIGTFILRLLLVCLGVEIIAVLGNFSAVVSFVLFGLSTSGWMIYEGKLKDKIYVQNFINNFHITSMLNSIHYYLLTTVNHVQFNYYKEMSIICVMFH